MREKCQIDCLLIWEQFDLYETGLLLCLTKLSVSLLRSECGS